MKKDMKKKAVVKPTKKLTEAGLFRNVSAMIDGARARIASVVNSELTILYWSTGREIKNFLLKNKRAEYGETVVQSLSKRLTLKYGRGWSRAQLWNCIRAVEIIPDKNFLYTLCRELSWSHIRQLIYLKDDLQREFYIRMCIYERWGVRDLNAKIDSMLYERTALSRKPEKLIRHDLDALRKTGRTSEDMIFRDPLVLDFLGLSQNYSEKELESAIIAELQKFISEIGTDFAFIARQKRISVDNLDHYIDLLFFHRGLRCLVAIDLKLERFKAEHKGQMELYLRWLEKHEMRDTEGPPVGIILCSDKSDEYVELLLLDDSRIKVARYMTELPPKNLLKKRLHEAIEIANRKSHGENKSSKASPRRGRNNPVVRKSIAKKHSSRTLK